MQLLIKTLSDKTITIEIDTSSTVKDVKARIQEKEGIPAYKQCLMYAGKQQEDKRYKTEADRTTEKTTAAGRGFLGVRLREERNAKMPKPELMFNYLAMFQANVWSRP